MGTGHKQNKLEEREILDIFAKCVHRSKRIEKEYSNDDESRYEIEGKFLSSRDIIRLIRFSIDSYEKQVKKKRKNRVGYSDSRREFERGKSN